MRSHTMLKQLVILRQQAREEDEDDHVQSYDSRILVHALISLDSHEGACQDDAEDYPDYVTARTNLDAVIALQELFPDKTVKSFELRKSNDDPYNNALHLDCCFQPVGGDKAILHKNGFLVESEYQWLVDFFGKENIFEISSEEMYAMTSNIFSISDCPCSVSETDFCFSSMENKSSFFSAKKIFIILLILA